MIRMIFLESITSIKESLNYKNTIIMDIITLLLIYSFLLYSGSGFLLNSIYPETSSKELLFLGYIFWSLSNFAITSVSTDISKESQRGTFEYKFLSIYPIEILLFGRFIGGIFIESMIISIITLFSFFIMKIPLLMNLKIIIILIITLLGMYGMGLTIGSLTLKEKKIGNFILLIQILLLGIGNVLTVNPAVKEYFKIIPLTQGIDIARNFNNVSFLSIFYFLLICLFWLILGTILFKFRIIEQKKNNSLGFY